MFNFFKKKKIEKNQLRFLREESGMTPKQLAVLVEDLHKKKFDTKLTVSWQMIVAIEKHRYQPSYGLAMLIAEVLGKEMDQVF